MTSLAEIRRSKQKKYGTKNQTYNDLPIGTKVLVITPSCDHRFFYEPTGIVTKSDNEYLGITVKFDEAMRYVDGEVLREFNFHPTDLAILEKSEVKKCPYCHQVLKESEE